MNPYLELVISALLLSTSGSFIKWIALPPTAITFFRFVIPAVLFFIFLKFKKVNLFVGNNKVILLASLLNAIRMFLYFVGFIFASIGIAALLHYTWPIFAVIFSIILLKEKVTKKTIFLLVIAFVGILFIFSTKDFSFKENAVIGMIAMILSSILNALATVLFKKDIEKYSRSELVFYQNLVGAFLFLPFVFINVFPNTHQLSITFLYVLLIGVIGYWLFFSALKKVKASTASVLVYVELIGSIILGIIIFNEKLTFNMIIGGLMIIIASILLRKSEKA